MQAALELRHMSARTVEAYLGWVRRFVRFHRGVHPAAVGERGVEAFLSHLASAERVSASTQNQALAALLFLYAVVLGAPLGKLAVVHARRPVRVPVVMTREEVGVLLGTMSGTPRLMASLLYGSGLRLHECVGLRVKDVDVGGRQIWVRRGKSMRDRATPLPLGLIDGLQVHLAAVREQHDADVHRGCGYVELPEALALKPERWSAMAVAVGLPCNSDVSAFGDRGAASPSSA